MTVPPRFGEEREPRNFLGWILTLVLVMLASGFAAYYYTTVGSEQHRQAQVVDEALREAVLTTKKLQPLKWKAFDMKLAEFRKTDLQWYSLLRAVASYERTKTVDKSDINRLKKSDIRVHRIVAEVYTKTFSKSDIDIQSNKINKDLFAGVLAGIHLHERNGDSAYRSTHLPKKEDKGVSSDLSSTVIGAVGFLGMLLIAAYAGLRSAGFLKPLGHPLQNIGLFDADRLAMRSAQIMTGMAAVGVVTASVGILNPYWMAVVEAGLIILLVFVLTLTPIWGRRFCLNDIGIGRENLLKNIGWGVAGFFANIPILVLVNNINMGLFSSMPDVSHPIVNEIKNASNVAMWIAIFVSASVQAPIVEEVLFRGTLLPAMARVFRSPVLAIVLSSLLFAIGHSTGLPSWLPLATIGAMAAALTYQTRSLVPAMVLHAVHNGSMLLMTIFLT